MASSIVSPQIIELFQLVNEVPGADDLLQQTIQRLRALSPYKDSGAHNVIQTCRLAVLGFDTVVGAVDFETFLNKYVYRFPQQLGKAASGNGQKLILVEPRVSLATACRSLNVSFEADMVKKWHMRKMPEARENAYWLRCSAIGTQGGKSMKRILSTDLRPTDPKHPLDLMAGLCLLAHHPDFFASNTNYYCGGTCDGGDGHIAVIEKESGRFHIGQWGSDDLPAGMLLLGAESAE